MKEWNAFQAACLCQAKLKALGLSVDVTVDVDRVLGSVKAVGKPYLTPWLDPRHNDFSASNYFWIIASNDDGPQIVGGGRLDIYDGDAASGIHRQFVRGYGADAVIGVNPAFNQVLNGRITYLGDLYSRAAGGLGRRSIRYFLGVANYISAVSFDADVTFSFMRKADVQRGSADVNGFSRRMYEPLMWGTVPVGLDETGVLVYRNGQEDSSYFREVTQELERTELQSVSPPDHLQPANQAVATSP